VSSIAPAGIPELVPVFGKLSLSTGGNRGKKLRCSIMYFGSRVRMEGSFLLPPVTSEILNSVRMSCDEIPTITSLSDRVIGFPMILTDLGRPRSFRGNGSCGQETCLLMASLTDGTRRMVMCGFEEQSWMKAGETRYLNTVDMVAVSGSFIASSGRSKSPEAMRGWSMSKKGPIRISASA